MAEAMIAPLIKTKLQPAKRIFIHDVSSSTMDRISKAYEVETSESIKECIDGADLIVMAVKPQNTDLVCRKIRDALRNSLHSSGSVRSNATMLSIAAGKTIQSFVDGCGGTVRKIARSMPNTPAMIGKGITVWTCTQNIKDEEKVRIKNVLSCLGKTIYVEDESFIDMATSISGSGPAYIFMLMEAMIDAGVHMGFSRDVATLLVHQTLLGSTLYAMSTNEHPAILRNSVTSPAGTTASAMYELEKGKFRVVIKDAIWACYRRSLEMGGHCSNVGPGRYSFNVATPSRAEEITHQAPSGECVDDDDKVHSKRTE